MSSGSLSCFTSAGMSSETWRGCVKEKKNKQQRKAGVVLFMGRDLSKRGRGRRFEQPSGWHAEGESASGFNEATSEVGADRGRASCRGQDQGAGNDQAAAEQRLPGYRLAEKD